MIKVLVIEDEEAVRKTISDLLEIKGYNVFSASGGKEGVKLAMELIPDLILCDIMMTDYDGYKVLKKLLAESKTALIPFIFITAKAEMSDLRLGMDLGADDYIVKPFKAKELYKAIETRLAKHKSILKQLNETKVSGKKSQNYSKLKKNGYVFVEIGKTPHFIKIGDIKCATVFGDYSNILMGNGDKIIVRKTLKSLEENLPDDIFVRIHHSTIINLNHVDRLVKMENQSYKVYLINIKEPFTISRRYASKLKSLLSL
ncbi:MAG: response regulator [Ignavibacteriaceae bacterium]